ncbi:MAG TPA: molecular chaperone HtpG [Candidatus Scatavimonas merdigallinarum]|uniref:Chaperone protein HtpG n=1 Tax=Candidatus Scatavimonas merdigallinarum TaxID=2840914 RepID=A0A9D0ZJA4_9FIRM|nr:molecular chaperone HtpG [Candidatus Scatavimonas merdigallinarum]
MRKKSFKAESKRLLDLMIHSIYTHKEIFLREIISNASDALDKLHFVSLTDENARKYAENLAIEITADKEKRILQVSDNGIGMTDKELEENLGTIAKSGSFQFKNDLDEKDKADIIGQFGVGFYSAFMVSDDVTVRTKRYDSDTAYCWSSNGADGYTIEECKKDTPGTDVIMHIKEDAEDEHYSEYLENYRLRELVKTYSDYIRYPIIMDVETSKNTAKEGEEPKYETVVQRQTVNSMVPIWQRSKKEVSDQACADYYMEHFMDREPPLSTIRISAEGLVSYKAMLFIPSVLPYGYYTKEFEKGLQLYSSGVLIMDKCAQLLPDYFAFVKGVVDSPDLSLNISRELLQHDRQLSVIAKNIEKKIKAELVKLMESDFEKYQSFWKHFGRHIKYGVVSDFGMHKEILQDLLIFHSSAVNGYTTLKDYVSRMKEDQKFIYYACGESIQQIALLPQTELCRDKGYEMLYLPEDVDEFAVQALMQFEEKPFKSVTADDAQLQSEEEKKETEKQQEENKELLAFVKEALGEKIAKAVISDKLKSHPVCMTAEGPVTIETEKYFASVPGDEMKPKAVKVLELNASHKAFAALKDAYKIDKEKARNYAQLLYNQALLIAGLPIEDPVAYCDLVCALM